MWISILSQRGDLCDIAQQRVVKPQVLPNRLFLFRGWRRLGRLPSRVIFRKFAVAFGMRSRTVLFSKPLRRMLAVRVPRFGGTSYPGLMPGGLAMSLGLALSS